MITKILRYIVKGMSSWGHCINKEDKPTPTGHCY